MVRDFGGAVGALIIDDDDADAALIILAQQRTDSAADPFGLVTRRNDRDNARPVARQAGQGGDRRPPEPAVTQPQHQPDDESQYAEEPHHLRYPASRNQATASASPSTA